MTVSAPTSTSLSMTQVSGKRIVTPWSMNCRHFARRICWSISDQFGASIASQDFVGIVGLHGHHALPGLGQNRSHVCEVKLAVMIVGVQFVDVLNNALASKA